MQIPRTANRRLAAALSLTLLWSQVATGSVAAHEFGSSSCGPSIRDSVCAANNGEHHLYFAGLASAQASSTLWIMANRYSVQTDVNMYQGLSFNDNDARVYDYVYGSNGFWGWTICPTGSAKGGVDPDQWCRPQEVRYNLTYYAEAFNTEAKRKYVACHELGHTVGLREGGNTADCMWPWNVVNYVLSADHIAHINEQY